MRPSPLAQTRFLQKTVTGSIGAKQRGATTSLIVAVAQLRAHIQLRHGKTSFSISARLLRDDSNGGNTCYTEVVLPSFGATVPQLRKVFCYAGGWVSRTYYREKPLSSYSKIF